MIQSPQARRFPPEPWLTLCLGIATLFTAWPQPHDGGLAFLVLATTTLASTRFRLGPVALLVLFAVGVELRYAQFGVGISDVPQTIKAALDELQNGLNPYAADVAAGRAPFPYGPLALLWYLPLHDPRLQEFAVSMLLLGALTLRGQPLGLALFAAMPLTVQLASDGSNDHTAALLLLVALVVLERMPRAGALLIGLAAGFKIYALAWLPPVLIWAGAGAFVTGLVGVAVIWLPAALLWGADNIVGAFQAADAVHKTPYYSLGEALSRAHISFPRTALDTFRLAAGGIAALLVSPLAKSHRGAVLGGTVIYLVTLYSGFWSSPAYLVPPVLVLCWYIDSWLGPATSRVKWPSDPVGQLTEAVDERWPTADATRDPTRIRHS